MNTLTLTYDGEQHATALREPHHNTVAIDCPITAKGDEFSPGNLLGISVAGCMLLSMGAVAHRAHLDLRGTAIDIQLTETDKPFAHVDSITLVFDIPRNFSPADRNKLEKAAEDELFIRYTQVVHESMTDRNKAFITDAFGEISAACVNVLERGDGSMWTTG